MPTRSTSTSDSGRGITVSASSPTGGSPARTWRGTLRAFLTGSDGPWARIVMMVRADGRGVVRVGLLGRLGAGACPNLLQRRPATGSAADESAEYQRFFSRAPTRSGSLQQIWTIGAASGPSAGGGRRLDGDHDEHPDGRTGSRERRPAASTSLDPRARTSSRRSRGLPGDLAGQVTCSALTRRSRGPRRRRRAFRPGPGRSAPRPRPLRRCSSGRTGTSSAAPGAGCSPPGCRRRRGRPRRRRRGSRAAWWSRR